MKNRIKLVIIFNHKYNQNLEKLRHIYSKRFSKIQFLVPFYEGNDPDVIPVFESSYYFQGYIVQGFNFIFEDGEYDYIIFAGDDLILNPCIDENNVLDYFNLYGKDAFINRIIPLHQASFWSYERFKAASQSFLSSGVNFLNEIPCMEIALKRNEEYKFEYFPVNKKTKFYKPKAKDFKTYVKRIANKYIFPIKQIDYPLYCGYSDFFIISSARLKDFCKICGVFSAMNLFVEIAIPTALVLTIKPDKMNQQKDINLKAESMWVTFPNVEQFEKDCNYQISKMTELWPKDYAYLHPLKLSKWKD